MKTTDYTGIDYGNGHANIDAANGIRFGVISQNTPNSDAIGDIWSNGTDLGFEQFQADVKAQLRGALSDYFSDYKSAVEQSKLDTAVENAFDAISDNLGDSYGGESGPFLYESDGYKLQTSETDIWVLKSPYYTHAQFCSPCAPGAGNLDTACPDGPKTYCLGHDWFDDNKAPYPVYRVDNGQLQDPV